MKLYLPTVNNSTRSLRAIGLSETLQGGFATPIEGSTLHTTIIITRLLGTKLYLLTLNNSTRSVRAIGLSETLQGGFATPLEGSALRTTIIITRLVSNLEGN